MNIKVQLKLLAAIIIISFFAFLASILFSIKQYRQSLRKSDIGSQITTEVYRRRLVANDYLLHPSERAKSQWLAQQSKIQKAIEANSSLFHEPQEKEAVDIIRSKLGESTKTFEEILLIEDESIATLSSTLAKKDRLEGQLTVAAQETISAAGNLQKINRQAADQALQSIISISTIALSFFLALLLFSFRLVWKSTKKAEEKRAEDKAIINSIGDGLILTDQYGRVTLINDQIKKMFGYTKKEVYGKWIFEAFRAIDKEGNAISGENSPVAQALLTGMPVMTIRDFYKKDESQIAIGLTVSPIIADEKPLGAILIFRDVTKEREIDRMKTEFISLASHQLRTPLSAMRWFLEMLLAGDAGRLTPEQKEMVTNVDISNNRMIELVDSLLNVSRIESGRIIVEPVPTDLKKLLEGIKNELTGKLKEKNQSLLISVYDNLPLINIDPKLISEVYLNLLTNAIKYSPKGGEIHVFVSKKDDQVISQVSDNGYGIPEKDQVRLFQKFFRGDNIVKRVTEGTGLGLYLAKAIIESSKGKIWFKSQEGRGTSFWFSLPISGMQARKGEVHLHQ